MLTAVLFLAAVNQESWKHQAIVDVCELNHVLPGEGRAGFSQIILWRWCPLWNTHHVAQWFLIKEPGDVLVEQKGTRRIVTWRGPGGKVYETNAISFRETRTHYDPEVLDKEACPENCRIPYFYQALP